MSDPWVSRFAKLSPADIALLRAMTMLEIATVVPAQLAAALDVSEADVNRSVDRLRHDGWFRLTPSGATSLISGARIWLRYDSEDETPGQTPSELTTIDLQITERYLRFQLDELRDSDAHAARWAIAHRDEIIAAIRAGARTGLRREALALATAAWRVAAEVTDPVWWNALAEHGEAAAAGDPHELLALLTLSAPVFAKAQDVHASPKAESQYEHAVELAEALDEHDVLVSTLNALARAFHDSGQPERVAENLLKLANAHQTAGDTTARAMALAALGALMLDAGRAEFAETYLERAEDLLASLDHPAVGRWANVVELRGYALWETRNTIRARRCFRQALGMLEPNDISRERLQRLISTPIESIDLPMDAAVKDWRAILERP